MGNPAWHARFLQASLLNLVAPVSDHNPILLRTEGFLQHTQPQRFRFENRWLMEPELKQVIRKSWSGFGDLDILSRLSAIAETLELWGKKVVSNFRFEKKELKRHIERLQANHNSIDSGAYVEAKERLGKC